MRINHHLSPATLTSFAANRLPAALSVVAESHIAWCGECRRLLMNAKSGSVAADVETSQAAVPENAAKRTQTLTQSRQKRQFLSAAAAEKPGPGLPSPLLRLLGACELGNLGWRRVLPGLSIHELAPSGQRRGRLRLVRLDPGKALPEHAHTGSELTMVLRGSYSDEFGRFSIGDVAEMERRRSHRPVAEKHEPCVCLVAEEAPAMLRSVFARLLRPLIGL